MTLAQFVVTLGFIIIGYSQLPGQAFTNHQKINYTVDDGLPSNECHDILQDSLGYIWIATDRGLVRYDGYNFLTYGLEDGLEDIACIKMSFDSKGHIWILTASQKIYIYNNDSNRIKLYEHQDVIDGFESETNVYFFHINANDDLILVTEAIGFLIIDKEGNYHLDRGPKVSEKNILFTRIEDDKLLISSKNSTAITKVNPTSFQSPSSEKDDFQIISQLVFNDKVVKEVSSKAKQYSRFYSAFKLDSIYAIIHLHSNEYLLERNEIIVERSEEAISDIVRIDSQYIVSRLFDRGVCTYSIEGFKKAESHPILTGVSATRILIDNYNNLWVTTLRNGIFYLKKNEVKGKYLDSDIGTSRVTQIEAGPKGIYFVTDKKNLYLTKGDHAELIREIDDNELSSITFDPFYNRLIVGTQKSFLLSDKHEFEQINYIQVNQDEWKGKGPVTINKIFPFDKDDYLAASFQYILMYDNLQEVQNYWSRPDVNYLKVYSAERIELGSYILGTNEGLCYLINKKISRSENLPADLKIRINAIKAHKDTYFFGTQGNGIVIYDFNTQPQVIKKTDGLISNVIEDIFIDSYKNIYALTKSGISKLKYDNNDSLQIENYTIFHGLPSNEVYDIAEMNDSLYVATANGIGVLSRDKAKAPLQEVLIENIQVNGKTKQHLMSLSFRENSLSLAYKSLDYSMMSSIPYRYRLNNSDWTYTSNTKADLISLTPDEYKFHVQAQNKDGVWGPAQTIRFRISPPWWKTAWIQITGIILTLFIFYTYFKSRLKRQEYKNTVEQEIRQLERSALQSQMNPHFIFNCLNSIQSFIIDNQKDKAMDYLSRFAKLIRQNLNASADETVALDIEISMLTNYLELERMRFDYNFNYSIDSSNIVSPEEISVPPMMIQPYVENAIIHGMKNKNGDGMIQITFVKKDNQIHIQIKDNGAGMQSKKDRKHRSLGMSITEKRLMHLAKQTGVDHDVKITQNEGTDILLSLKCTPTLTKLHN